MRTEVLEKAGKKVVLLGNEAIARGALEAGVGVATAYPGTPSSEVPMILAVVAKKVSLYLEYSSNEKVAVEVAAGAAWSGVRSLTAMKHFGLNVASDSVIPLAYTGVRAGLVIMVADDPSGWSSAQSEQDTRYYARMARLPMLEPSNPQECLDYTKLAFNLSEEFEVPVLLRTTTKVSHSIGTVKLGDLRKPKKVGKFEKDPERYFNFKPRLEVLHAKLEEKLQRIEKKYGKKLNQVLPGRGKIGVLTAGVSFEYVREALQELGINPPVARIALTYPLSQDFIHTFIKDKKAVLVVEELEPLMEDFVKQVAKEVNPNLKVYGKDVLPRTGEYSMEVVMSAIAKVFGKKLNMNFKLHRRKIEKTLEGLPPRRPVLCPGCPHRSTFYATRKVFGDAVYGGDIGCYMLGAYEPFEMNFIISMGAGVGIAQGIAKVSPQPVVAFIGDSTFFHAGMPALLNYKYNDERAPLVIVLDNGITAMTGHQPHPGSGITAMGEKVEAVKVEEVAKAFGVPVKVVNSFSQPQLLSALKEFKQVKGPRVLVSRGECRLITRRKFRSKGIPLPRFEIDEKKCTRCGTCTDQFACPAIEKVQERYCINVDWCWGCGVCVQICPAKAIRPIKERR